MFYSDKLIYSNKRKKGLKSITFSLLTIIISLIVALLLTSIIYKDSSLFTKIFTSFFTAPFASLAITNNTISTVAIFAVAAIAFLIAMKCGMFNIGISSQMMFGGATATIIAQHMINMPNGLSQIILLLVSIVAATSIATIIGILKAFLNVNEVVSSIMFNWIIYFIATMMVAKTCAVDPTGLYTQDLSHLTATGDTFNLVFQTSSGNS
jgi:simple sugar transport system permease protein